MTNLRTISLALVALPLLASGCLRDVLLPPDEGWLHADFDGDGWCQQAPCADDGVGAGDCDDTDASVHPEAAEACDGLDGDCDGAVPDDELDGDTDGWVGCDAWTGSDAAVLGGGDCDDGDAALTPADVDGDGWSSCDGDCADDDATQVPADEDGDGVTDCNGDCDDSDPLRTPGAAEVCDGIDNDCDEQVPADELDGDGDGARGCEGDCDDDEASLHPFDLDGDGFSTCDGDCDDADDRLSPADADGDGVDTCDGDCDDAEPTTLPGGVEVCDGVDNDCANGVDDGLSFTDWWLDLDQDGFGAGAAVSACSQPAGHVDNDEDCDDGSWLLNTDDIDGDGFSTCDGDCDDTDGLVSPAAVEACDGVDNDCDGLPGLDEGDADGDGVRPCDGDCDDLEATVNPGATDVPCNGVDDDCDGALPSEELDGDGDGETVCDGDCDDGDPAVGTFATEDCVDGIDNDCDGDPDNCTDWITFISKRDGGDDWDIWIADFAQTLFVQVTDWDGQDAFPHFSPDGSTIAFDSMVTGHREIFLVDFETLEVTQLTDPSNGCAHQSRYPDWSPNGEWVYYECATGSNLAHIRKVHVASGADAVAWGTDNVRHPTISPDGATLAAVVGPDSSPSDTELQLYELDTGGVTPLSATDDGQGNFVPTYTPDGEWIVFHRSNYLAGHTPPYNLYKIRPTGTDLAALTTCTGSDQCSHPHPSPDSTELMYTLRSGGDYTLRTTGIDGTGDAAWLDEGFDAGNGHWITRPDTIEPGHVDQDADGWIAREDCDDQDPDVNPGAAEVQCDGIDNDCDGSTEHEVPGDFSTIQAGISGAEDADQVCVAPGTYVGNLTFGGAEIQLIGVDGPEATILDAGGSGRAVTFTGYETPETVLQGFTITGGSAGKGGGIYISGASPTLVDLVVTGNTAEGTGIDGRGGGVYVHDSSSTLTRVQIIGNEAAGPTMDDGDGGGIFTSESVLTIEQSVIADNTSEDDGGGASFATSSVVTLTHSRVTGNVSSGNGSHVGGITVEYDSALVMEHCVVAGNEADGINGAGHAGGIGVWDTSEATITSSVISGNTAQEEGGGIKLDGSATVSITGSIVSHNSADDGGGVRYAGGSLIITSSDVWGNTPDQYSGVPNPTGVAGNVSVDPEFLALSASDPAEWDLHLSTTSPLIGAGDASVLDPDGSPTDMGVYGGPEADGWDLDGDGAPLWWQPGPYDITTYPAAGWDCDDDDSSVGPAGGC